MVAEKRVGQMLCGKWHLDKLLDIGGMAAVYEATHRNGNRVAVKVLHPIFPKASSVRERFLREGYLANRVNHPGAVTVLDDDTAEDGAVFLVMELLEGQSMEALLQRSGNVLSVQHVLAIADQTLDVLATAHGAGVIHRDIKPGNIFLTKQGQVKVLDFGLARLKEADPKTQLTGVGVVMGTSSYMAPEQARSQWDRVDGRTDLFAVGAVMFRSLAGRVVHEAETPTDRLLAAMTKPAISVGEVAPHLPKVVVGVIDRALKFSMDDRWNDAKAMQLAVRQSFALMTAHGQLSTPSSAPPPSESTSDSIVVDMTSEVHELGVEDMMSIAPQLMDRLPEVSAYLVEEMLTEADRLDPSDNGK
ncbi:MAG TPA: serine/threonine-protein kinase [Polyangiaceae bacterium]|nr:serine/threonine-protein kinase [Polyangiaceae bacterium]HOR33438.1 serine/threonine-protein kinase [Polyangiaceae bacterium]